MEKSSVMRLKSLYIWYEQEGHALLPEENRKDRHRFHGFHRHGTAVKSVAVFWLLLTGLSNLHTGSCIQFFCWKAAAQSITLELLQVGETNAGIG
jgi:hypothetical protein